MIAVGGVHIISCRVKDRIPGDQGGALQGWVERGKSRESRRRKEEEFCEVRWPFFPAKGCADMGKSLQLENKCRPLTSGGKGTVHLIYVTKDLWCSSIYFAIGGSNPTERNNAGKSGCQGSSWKGKET